MLPRRCAARLATLRSNQPLRQIQIFLGEEIGWRGYLLFRLAELMPMRKAALATGAFHAVFHLPLLLLTTTYQSEGKRWIVVPMVMVTLTLASVWYGWLRVWPGSIWPVGYLLTRRAADFEHPRI